MLKEAPRQAQMPLHVSVPAGTEDLPSQFFGFLALQLFGFVTFGFSNRDSGLFRRAPTSSEGPQRKSSGEKEAKRGEMPLYLLHTLVRDILFRDILFTHAFAFA